MSYPFRLAPNGAVTTVTQGSDESNGELIAVLTTTINGERVFYPTFGITDPVASPGIDPSEVSAKVAQYGPAGTTITSVTPTFTAEHQSTVLIQYE